jgi:hypothetical protein
MSEVNLIFEVHGYRPIWAKNHPNIIYSESRYRIYVDTDLITERTWSWDNNILLNENIWVYGDINSTYTLNIIPVIHNINQAKFTIGNLKISNILSYIKQITDLQIEYKLINTL